MNCLGPIHINLFAAM